MVEGSFDPMNMTFAAMEFYFESMADVEVYITGSWSGFFCTNFAYLTINLSTESTITYVPENATVTCSDASVWNGILVE